MRMLRAPHGPRNFPWSVASKFLDNSRSRNDDATVVSRDHAFLATIAVFSRVKTPRLVFNPVRYDRPSALPLLA